MGPEHYCDDVSMDLEWIIGSMSSMSRHLKETKMQSAEPIVAIFGQLRGKCGPPGPFSEKGEGYPLTFLISFQLHLHLKHKIIM